MADKKLSRPWWRAKFFALLAQIVKLPKRSDVAIPKNPQRILVLAPVLRGDYLILSPFLSNLSRACPKSKIGILVTKPGIELANVDPYVHSVIIYHKLPMWPRSIREIINFKPDVVIIPKGHPATTESMVTLFSKAKIRIGLSHPGHDFLLTHPIEHDWENEHRTEAFARLLEPFGPDPSKVRRRLHIGRSPKAEAWADQVLGVSIKANPLFSINLSASNPSRRWTLDGWRELLAELLSYRPDAKFIALSGPDERNQCTALAEEFEAVTAIATRSFLEAVALIARTDFLITVDTGTVQAAAARGIPMVVLYNGDHEVYLRFAPQSVNHRAVLAERGKPVSSIRSTEVSHEIVHLLVELEKL
jgi:ADP-heptose:LPS heptosyltransferase